MTSAQVFLREGDHRGALAAIEGVGIPDPSLAAPVDVEAAELLLECLHRSHDWERLISTGELLLTSLEPGQHPHLRCRLHSTLGTGYLRLGSMRRAEDHLRAAIHVARWEIQDGAEEVKHHRILSVMYKNLGSWAQSRAESTRAIELADERGLDYESGVLRKNLVIVLLKAGSITEADRLLDEAEVYLQRCSAAWPMARVRLVRSRIRTLSGSVAIALHELSELAQPIQELASGRDEPIRLEYLGDCYLAQREYQKALEHYKAAQKIAEVTAPKGDLIPELGHRLGEALANLGDPNAAILHCERGLRVARDTGDRYEECATYRVLAMAHRAAGNPTKARRLVNEGITLGRQYEIPYELARTLQWSGETHLQSKGRDDQMIGRMQLWEARAIYERIGLPNMVRTLDNILGFEDESEEAKEDAGAAVIANIAGLDKGALRFGIVTASEEVSRAVATIQSVATSRIPVLIMGESGVGKELLARALHQMSDRRKQPFVAVNCGALAPGLLDSELFGHERGAFTGAISSREGLFASADRGTLFLDEVGELSAAAQSTLLRILENGELRPVGRDEVKTIDVRIVAATNADLEELVGRGAFRRDLFYRLEGVSVKVPPLADREEDVRALFRYFFAQAAASAAKRITVAEDVEPMLLAYAWPGNVRELKHEVARAIAMAQDGTVLGRGAFLPKLASKSPSALRQAREREGVAAGERERILAALRAHRGNKADAARSLDGMKRTTLLYKMERLGIRPEEYQVKG